MHTYLTLGSKKITPPKTTFQPNASQPRFAISQNVMGKLLKALLSVLLLCNLSLLPMLSAQANEQVEQNTTSGSLININQADLQTLTLIKGVGQKKAERIIQFRQEHGPFKSIEALSQVKGISLKIIEINKGMLTY